MLTIRKRPHWWLKKNNSDEYFFQVLKNKGYSKLLLQIGRCEVVPSPQTNVKGFTLEYYRYKPSLDEDIDEASLVISHAGKVYSLYAYKIYLYKCTCESPLHTFWQIWYIIIFLSYQFVWISLSLNNFFCKHVLFNGIILLLSSSLFVPAHVCQSHFRYLLQLFSNMDGLRSFFFFYMYP